MQRRWLLVFGLMVMLGSVPTANATPVCEPTFHTETQNYPGAQAIPTSNNLLRTAGKAELADGEKFILNGQVLDTKCAPVPDAVVEIWQNDPYGQWILLNRRDAATPYPTFSGAGRAITDHDGRFTFITAFPAPLGNRAPYISLRILKEPLKSISSTYYFANDQRNDSDAIYSKLSPRARDDVTIRMASAESGELVGNLVIVLPKREPYLTY